MHGVSSSSALLQELLFSPTLLQNRLLHFLLTLLQICVALPPALLKDVAHLPARSSISLTYLCSVVRFSPTLLKDVSYFSQALLIDVAHFPANCSGIHHSYLCRAAILDTFPNIAVWCVLSFCFPVPGHCCEIRHSLLTLLTNESHCPVLASRCNAFIPNTAVRSDTFPQHCREMCQFYTSAAFPGVLLRYWYMSEWYDRNV